jgi:uncharacterized protein YukE
VEPLTPSDVKRWDVGAIHSVFETASGRADTLQRLGDNLQQVHDTLSDWQGEAGDAFRADVGKVRRDIEADGAESRQVAAAVSHAETDVRACKAELDDIERAADANGWTITPDWRIDVGNTGIGLDPIAFAAEQQAMQDALNACKAHAHSADHELATAIRGAVGEVQLDATGNPPGAAPPQGPPGPGGKPKTWQDMLLPGGAASGEPGGAPPLGGPAPVGTAGKSSPLEDTLLPAGAGSGDRGGKPPSLEDLMMGRGQPAGPGGQQPGSLQDMLGRLAQPGPPGAPAPRLNPADVQRFKAMARQSMALDGVPPDQIEAQLDAAVARTQQWLDNGMPNYVPPPPQAAPPPGFGEGFGDRWFATEQGIKNLLGQGGPGAPGVAESWWQMLKGTTEIAQNPVGAAIGEFQNALDSPSPAYYFGEKASDGAFALPGILFGGEGAGLGELADVSPGAVYDGLSPLPHSPIGLDSPINYHQWGPSAAQDLYSAFAHGEPTAELSQQVADMSTHYIGDNPDRVILGKWDGQDGGYIGEARGQGGIYFDTGDPTWDAMTYGLDKAQEQSLVWPVNEQFLRTQMENHVGRIEYVLDRDKYSSLEDMMLGRAGSYSAMEVEFLAKNAAAYGYERVGDAWVYMGGGG